MGKNLYFSVSPLSPPPAAAGCRLDGEGLARGKAMLKVRNLAEEGGGPCVYLALGMICRFLGWKTACFQSSIQSLLVR